MYTVTASHSLFYFYLTDFEAFLTKVVNFGNIWLSEILPLYVSLNKASDDIQKLAIAGDLGIGVE